MKEKLRAYIITNFNIKRNAQSERNIESLLSKIFIKSFKSKYAEIQKVKKRFDYFEKIHATWLDKVFKFQTNEDETMDESESDEEIGR